MLADELAKALVDRGSGPGLTAHELGVAVGGLTEQEVTFALCAAHGLFRSEPGTPRRWRLASDTSRPAPGGPAGPAVATPTSTGSTLAPQGLGHSAVLTPPLAESRLLTPPLAESSSAQRAVVAPAPAVYGDAAPLELYAWQVEALQAWAAANKRGVIEAVTGTGKTMVGIAAALDELTTRRGQVLVLVPTAELALQWKAELVTRLPSAIAVGCLGAGCSDSLATHDVLVGIVNSARAIDVRPIRQGGLLVADECHRYGSAVNHLALDQRFRRRLGLSATYARNDDGNGAWLDPYFGATCFRLGYRRALDDGITARFSLSMIGVRFAPDERSIYDELSEQLAKAWSRLVNRHGLEPEPFEAFLQAVNTLANSEEDGAGTARAYRQTLLERRRLLADTPAKDDALAALAPAVADADRALVFTQTIAAAERAAALLAGAGLRAGVLHSGVETALRRDVMRRFANGELDVLAAPRVLDEGVDVPAVDLAIISGASRSRRQMIQRMGRVLRRKPDGRRARFGVLFVEGTVEDPACGAHQTFLAEMLDVADRCSCLAAGTSPEQLCASLAPSWPRPPRRRDR